MGRTTPTPAVPAIARLDGGPVAYTLRRSSHARAMRVVVHPERGVMVTVPGGRGNQAEAERRAVDFLRERESWLRRHLERQADIEAELEARGGARDGGSVPYLGSLHAIRIAAVPPGSGRSGVERVGEVDGDQLVIRRTSRERRTDAAILEAWLRDRARAAISELSSSRSRSSTSRLCSWESSSATSRSPLEKRSDARASTASGRCSRRAIARPYERPGIPLIRR